MDYFGHGPFSHVGEESGLYPELEDIDGEKRAGHEIYTRLIVRDIFGEVIDKNFKKQGITKEDILCFLSGFVTDKKDYFIKDLISGQLDTDRMDYLLRDSHYCGVQYGKYDLPRLLDTLCICHPDNDPSREWLVGVESNGVHAVEEFIFARYWMFIQVYFHKTRRIYDHYLTNFIKYYLRQHYDRSSYPADLKEYISWNDTSIIRAIDTLGKDNVKWATNLYKRDHLKEAFVSIPHPEEHEDQKKDMLGKIAWVIGEAKKNFNIDAVPDNFHIDQSKTSSSKYLIDIPLYVKETQDDEVNKFYAIPVVDKLTKEIKSLQDYSLPVKNISDKKINILRVYASKTLKQQVCDFCNEMFTQGYDNYIEEVKRKKIEIENKRKELEVMEQDIANQEQEMQNAKEHIK